MSGWRCPPPRDGLSALPLLPARLPWLLLERRLLLATPLALLLTADARHLPATGLGAALALLLAELLLPLREEARLLRLLPVAELARRLQLAAGEARHLDLLALALLAGDLLVAVLVELAGRHEQPGGLPLLALLLPLLLTGLRLLSLLAGLPLLLGERRARGGRQNDG